MPTRDQVIRLLSTDDAPRLFRKADTLRRKLHGDVLQVRGIIEISNFCRCNCLYCGLRAGNSALHRYRMAEDEIVRTACEARSAGFMTIVLQSGEDPHFSGSRITNLVTRIKNETGCAITLSLGEWSRREYEEWFEAGADRYLLKHETSNRGLYEKLHPGFSFENRIKCIKDLKDIGFQTGSGAMIGLPGQSVNDLADDIILCKELQIDMAGFGPFISSPDTPFAHERNGSIELSLRVVAAARLVLKEVHLPATTALGILDEQARLRLYSGGANVIMPDITPEPYRSHYSIYPGKGQGTAHIEEAMQGARDIAHTLGWTIDTGFGHSIRRGFADSSKR